MESKNFLIYKHTNRINNKVYIGITSQNPEKRWKNNGYGYKNQPKFYNAILKYGWDNFSHEVINDNLSEEECMELEIKLIEEYNSINNGYNQRVGGISVPKYATIENKLRLSESHKGQECPMKGKKHTLESLEKMSARKRKTVIGINIFTKETVSFKSTKLAGEAMGLANGSGIAACAGKRKGIKSIADHVWYYEGNDIPSDEYIETVKNSIGSISLRNRRLKRKISATNINTGEELIFDSIADAAMYFGKTGNRIKEHIASYCKNNLKYLNHNWKYIN